MTRWCIECLTCGAKNDDLNDSERHVRQLKEMHEEMHPDHRVEYEEVEG